MAKERVGFRRLYRCRGVSLGGGDAWDFSFTESDIDVDVYIGPKPHLGVAVQESDKYVAPGESSILVRAEYQRDASRLPAAGNFFTEIRSSVLLDVSDDLSSRFRAKETAAQEELLSLAVRQAKTLNGALDLTAGVIGLRFHRQFVLEHLNDNPFVVRADDDTPISFTSPAVELLRGITLRRKGAEQLKDLLSEVGQSDASARDRASSVLYWLLRAWEERDSVAKFLSLFIPLELILEGYGQEPTELNLVKTCTQEIFLLIKAHGGERKAALQEFLQRMASPRPPGLVSRFRQMARSASCPTWEEDVRAFTCFNDSRQKLLHKGDPAVVLSFCHPTTEVEKQIYELQDLTERYVCWTLFGDMAVYPRRKRPTRNKS